MLTNVTVSNNSQFNMTNSFSFDEKMHNRTDWVPYLKINIVFDLSLILLASPINFWFLISILTCSKMRLIMRNQLICVMLLNNLVAMLIVLPMDVVHTNSILGDLRKYDCRIFTIMIVVEYMLSWIENWYILIFLLKYIFDLLNLDIINRLTSSPLLKFILKCAVIIGPWAFSALVAPTVLGYHGYVAYGNGQNGYVCIYETEDSFKALNIFGKTIPLFIKPVLFLGIIVAYRRHQSANNKPLLPPEEQIDNAKMYFSTCLLSIFTTGGIVLLFTFHLFPSDHVTNIWIYLIFDLICGLRTLFLPLCFLFQEDIRIRCKSWVPCITKTSGPEVTAQHQRHSDVNTETGPTNNIWNRCKAWLPCCTETTGHLLTIQYERQNDDVTYQSHDNEQYQPPHDEIAEDFTIDI